MDLTLPTGVYKILICFLTCLFPLSLFLVGLPLDHTQITPTFSTSCITTLHRDVGASLICRTLNSSSTSNPGSYSFLPISSVPGTRYHFRDSPSPVQVIMFQLDAPMTIVRSADIHAEDSLTSSTPDIVKRLQVEDSEDLEGGGKMSLWIIIFMILLLICFISAIIALCLVARCRKAERHQRDNNVMNSLGTTRLVLFPDLEPFRLPEAQPRPFRLLVIAREAWRNVWRG